MASTVEGSVVVDVDMNVNDAEHELTRLKKKITQLDFDLGEKVFKRHDLSSELVQARKELEKLKAEKPAVLVGDTFADNTEYYEKLKAAEKRVSDLSQQIKKIDEEIDAGNLTLEYTKMRYGEILPIAQNLRKEEEARVAAEKQAKEEAKKAREEAKQAERQAREEAKQAERQAREEAKQAERQAREEAKQAERQAREEAKRQEQAFKEAEAAVAAQIAQQRLLDIKESAVVADQKLVDMQEELTRLAQRRKELEASGVGLGHKEYDDILVRTKEINQELREYQDGLLAANEREKNIANSAGEIVSPLSSVEEKLSSILEKLRQQQLMVGAVNQELMDAVGIQGKVKGLTQEFTLGSKIALVELAQVGIKPLNKIIGIFSTRVSGAAKQQKKLSDEAKKTAGSMGSFASCLKGILASAFIFNILSAGLRNMTQWMGKAVKSNKQASAAIAKLKGALLTLAQPILQVVIPVFITLVNIITKVVSAISSVVSAIFGTTADKSAAAAENLYDEQKALDGVGSAAKEAGKQLANFDEINQFSSEDSAGGGGGGTSGIEPDFDNSFIKDELDKITALLGGALLAIGVVLTFTGANIPLGLGLMAVGAIMLGSAIMANWDSISQALQGPLGVITALFGGALLVLGAILAFSGANIPLGLGLMVAGALALAGGIAANWDTLSGVLQGPIGVITALLSGALLVLGAIMAFSGANIGLGIGLMILGAVGLAATVAANWNAVSEALQGPIGVVTALVSGALIVLGAIFTFTGAHIALGIALMALGAAGLATAAAVNWETIQTALQGPIGTITAIVSTALLVLGAVLLFSGAAIPLGIGMIAVGAIGLAASMAANWDSITQTLGGTIGAITAIVSAAMLVLGVILIFTGAAAPLGLGLLIAGATGLAVAVAPNWDFIKEAISGAYDSMIQWWDTTGSKFFTLEYWAGLAKDMLDGLFGGLANIGERISEWGGSFINGVKDFFGIHSPSTEFESLGGYMMAGLGNGVNDSSTMVVSSFNVMFTAITALCTDNVALMQASLAAFLAHMATVFLTEWSGIWKDSYTATHSNILKVLGDISALNAKLASIERNITITITTVRKEVSGGSGGGISSRETVPRMSLPRIANIPALARGAVIPPNREFMAILGDQKSGTNIEAPLDTIVEAFNRANRESGGNAQVVALLQALLSAVKAGQTMEVDRRQFGRVVREVYNEESRRVGVNFAGG